jgi:nuclear pore complex protein Nup205
MNGVILAVVLCAIARLKSFLPNEIQLLVEWLSSNSSHPLTYYILTAVLLIIDPIYPISSIPSVRQTPATDVSLITFITEKLEPSAKWKNTGLKATVLLKWTLLLTESRHNDTTLEHCNGFKTEELVTQVWNAVQGDTFTYLAIAIQHLGEKYGSFPVASLLDSFQSDQQTEEKYPFLSSFFFLALETLVRSFITLASSELPKIKQRQEDLLLATTRTDRNGTASRFASSLPPESGKPRA